MNQARIFLPVAALALMTMLVILLVAIVRFRAGFAKHVSAEDFRYGESARVPGYVAIPNRVYMNLLEAPVLFYVACIVFFVTSLATPRTLVMAWIYVGLRAGHALIHLTYNKVTHRLILFGASNFVLAGLWVTLAVRLWQTAG